MGQRLAWSWTGAAFGAALAVPAAIVALFDVESGLAIATGMLPAAMLGLLPRRRARVLVVVLGALTGASIAVGGLLAGEPVLAVAAAVLFVDADPGAGWYAAAAVATLAGATATRASRWYVTAGFTTFLVFLLLLYLQPETADSRFAERLLETALGVGIAACFGLILPRLTAASHRPPAPRPPGEAGDPAAARARR